VRQQSAIAIHIEHSTAPQWRYEAAERLTRTSTALIDTPQICN